MLTFIQIIADAFHLLSVLVLLLRMYAYRTLRGISYNTQLLYLIVFSTRYLNFFSAKVHLLYLMVYKVLFVTSAWLICFLFRKPYLKNTYDKNKDKIHYTYILIPTICVHFLLHGKNVFSCFREFSYYLEAVSILPQLFMTHSYAAENEGTVETLTSHYVVFLGLYRVLYMISWIYKILIMDVPIKPNIWIAGLLQALLYINFLYYYTKSKVLGEKMKLPV